MIWFNLHHSILLEEYKCIYEFWFYKANDAKLDKSKTL